MSKEMNIEEPKWEFYGEDKIIIGCSIFTLEGLQKRFKILSTDRQRQQEINEEHKKLNGELREEINQEEKINNDLSDDIAELFKRLDNSISKDVIKDKILELWIKCPKNSINDFMINERNNKIQVLEELLQGSDKQ